MTAAGDGHVTVPRCDGRAALGPCRKPALYQVADEKACGLHMAQVVKFHLGFRRDVIVSTIEWAR